ncbi:hypothetical protein CWC38_06540 [Kocuria tytonicola]|uniref:SRPBCC family protein n=1 Tax=Kocuria tytonicola TaxID=2055946 RepID=UPI000EF8BCB9|nr:SRPBCC family protein [Kocuria tytonicola]RLZ03286.1 hypothetical protein CWC38_06540 [Kocuria tytonicola]
MEMTVARRGSADPRDVWRHYLWLPLWTEWAPHLTRVDADSPVLSPGATGTVTAAGVLPVHFRILAVDPARRSWSWRVGVGPVRLLLEHDVAPASDGGTRASIRIHGPALVLTAYRPLMGWALSRLVHVSGGR